MRYDFTGAFAPYICGLIAQKRAFGFDYLESERILYMFERFCQEQFPNETQITQQLVLKWAECRDCERNLFRLNRVSVIRELARYMNGKEELGLGYARIGFDDLTYTNVCGFLDWLTVSRGCSPQTVNLRLMAIRSFAKYSSIVDPAKIYFQVELANVPVKKAHGKVVEFMSLPALEALFLQPNTKKTTGFRDFCFMILMYDVAARCQELLDLRIGDLELQQNTPSVYLTGKGAKMRKLPILIISRQAYRRYQLGIPAIRGKDTGSFLLRTAKSW